MVPLFDLGNSMIFFNLFSFLWNIGCFDVRYIFYTLEIFFIFITFFIFGDYISCVKLLVDLVWYEYQELLFGDYSRDDFIEPTSITSEKMFMSLGVEDGYGPTSIFVNVIFSVVSFGVNGWVALLVSTHGITSSVASITCAVTSVLPSVTYICSQLDLFWSAISVLK